MHDRHAADGVVRPPEVHEVRSTVTATYTRLSTESLSLMEWRHFFQFPTAEWTRTADSYLSETSDRRGWGSVKTCSVNGPGGPDLSSALLAADSETSVASMASSADCAG
ncbi:hypothetical protein EYF80_006411 [Liparis tanakae]|uniref:Uncharacterized protein n=1 Tax=Liparis tanakae TaxID=230148 RepID=A0A4Z2IZK7_9TELE|nr:hypothetical protein EYF80_006411 [Liparis tanakae]